MIKFIKSANPGFTLIGLLRRSRRSCQGFTLIEALISVAIVSVIGLLITTMLARTFESNTKTKLLGVIKQNGQNALNFIDNAVRNADSVVCVRDTSTAPLTAFQSNPATYTGNLIVLKSNIDQRAVYTRISIISTPGNNNGVATDSPTWSDSTSNESNEYQLCNTLPTNGQILIGSSSGIEIDSTATTPAFTLSRGPKDVVQIYFALKNTGSSTDFTNSIVGNQVFQTTVVLR